MKVIPAVDILYGRAVRLMKGEYEAVTSYDNDPVAVAAGFVEQGATIVHVVDLDAARGRQRSEAILGDLGGAGIPFQLGGGIRTPEAAEEALSFGAERIVIGSVLLSGHSAAARIAAAVGPERIVAAVDVRDGRARGSGWTDGGLETTEVVSRLVDLGIERTLVTGIETDGTMEGPAVELFAHIRNLAPGLSMIASGGVGSLGDIRHLAASDIGIEGVIIGRALYENRFTLPEAIEAASRSSGVS
jgi:phosphoribosylformimino-5-aminoimidazole carboxamide ribotide isomerase